MGIEADQFGSLEHSIIVGSRGHSLEVYSSTKTDFIDLGLILFIIPRSTLTDSPRCLLFGRCLLAICVSPLEEAVKEARDICQTFQDLN